jgi:putative Mg2+ transporter-C (MgtC) family protein
MIFATFEQTLFQEFSDFPSEDEIYRVLMRLLMAIVLGGVLGYQREQEGKPAGMRAYILVSLGAALLVLVPQRAGMDPADLSRIIQGIVTGIGFIGGGAILKLSTERTVLGLTTAAGLWATAAVGITAGLGRLWSAMLATLAVFLILSVLNQIENRLENKNPLYQKVYR